MGFKSEWFDRRLQVNASWFHTRSDNLLANTQFYQTLLFPSPNLLRGSETGPEALFPMYYRILRNSHEATFQGLELEVVGRPLPGLQLDLALGTIDDEFESNRTLAFIPFPPGDMPQSLQHTPNVEFNVGVLYEFSLERWGDFSLRASWNHRGKVFGDFWNLPVYEQGKRGLLSARIALRLADGKTEVALWVRNLLDREYQVDSMGQINAGLGSELITFGPPRSYGIEVTRHFGD